jgi:hypothetical protein
LAQQRLARGDVAIRLDPQRRTARVEATGARERAHALEERGIALGDEREKLRLALREDERRVAFELPHRRRERALGLAGRFLIRPQATRRRDASGP